MGGAASGSARSVRQRWRLTASFPPLSPTPHAPPRSNAAFPWEPRTDMVVGMGLSYLIVPKFHFGFYG